MAMTRIPSGTSLTVWTSHGGYVTGGLINDLVRGVPAEEIADIYGDMVIGAKTYLPGAEIPDYVLHRLGLYDNIKGSYIGVDRATPLSQLLKPNMGHMNWGACLEVITP